MKTLLLALLLPLAVLAGLTFDLHQIRGLYNRAPKIKQDASQLNKLMLLVDSGSAAPVLVCYKGANEMIQAKYIFNPITKFEKFNKGKEMIEKAIRRDTLNLEMRFVRFSIQSNLPAFLNYHDELASDRRYLLANSRNNKDTELKEMIFNYFSTQSVITKEELKQLKN